MIKIFTDTEFSYNFTDFTDFINFTKKSVKTVNLLNFFHLSRFYLTFYSLNHCKKQIDFKLENFVRLAPTQSKTDLFQLNMVGVKPEQRSLFTLKQYLKVIDFYLIDNTNKKKLGKKSLYFGKKKQIIWEKKTKIGFSR